MGEEYSLAPINDFWIAPPTKKYMASTEKSLVDKIIKQLTL